MGRAVTGHSPPPPPPPPPHAKRELGAAAALPAGTLRAGASTRTCGMSRVNRQSSWQEELARNFSRIFFRSKSQDLTKADGEVRGTCSDAEKNEPSSPDHDPTGASSPDPAVHPPQAVQGAEGEGEDRTPGDELPVQHPSQPSSPTPPLDAFLRRLGSLFQPREQVAEQAPPGMTWSAEGNRDISDPAEKQRLETGEGENSATTNLQEQGTAGEDQRGSLNKDLGADNACMQEAEGSDERQPLVLSCPSVVTYATYRGQKEIQKLRKIKEGQPVMPISEEEEAKSYISSVSQTQAGKNESPSQSTTEADVVDSVFLNLEQKSQANSAVAVSIRDSTGRHPVLTLQESGPRLSALTHEPEPGSCPLEIGDLDFHPGAILTEATAASVTDSSDKLTWPLDIVNIQKDSLALLHERTTGVMAKNTSADTRARTEQAETLSLQEGPVGSPSTAGDASLSGVASTWGNEATADSPFCSQHSQCCVSLSGAQGSLNRDLVSTDMAADLQGQKISESVSVRSDCLQDLGVEQGLQQESKLLVNIIVKNAIEALKEIESKKYEYPLLSVGCGALSFDQRGDVVEDEDDSFQSACIQDSSSFKQSNSSLWPDQTQQSSLISVNKYKSTQHPIPDLSIPVIMDSNQSDCVGTDKVKGSSLFERSEGHRKELDVHLISNSCDSLSVDSREPDCKGDTGDVLKLRNKSVGFSRASFGKQDNSNGNIIQHVTSLSEPSRYDSGTKNKDDAQTFRGSGDVNGFLMESRDAINKDVLSAKDTSVCDVSCDKNEVNKLLKDVAHTAATTIVLEASQRMESLDKVTGRGTCNSPRSLLDSLNANIHAEQDRFDIPNTRDKDLLLPEGYSVANMGTDANPKGVGSRSTGTETDKCASKKEKPQVSDSNIIPSGHILQAASGVRNEASQWLSEIKPHNCTFHVEQLETLGQGAQARSDDNVSSKASSLHFPGKKVHLESLRATGRSDMPAHPGQRLHELDLHENEGGFAVIREEEEMDTVFVNDTGPMISPTSKRGKVYPFSLSPIFEEESIREELCMEDLQEPPATDEDLQGVKHQASSILSLLQSVSERLQASALSDSSVESSDEPSVLFNLPSWDRYLGGEEDEMQTEEDNSPMYSGNKLEQPTNHKPFQAEEDSLGLLNRFANAACTNKMSTLHDEQVAPINLSDCKGISSTPLHSHARSSGCVLDPLEIVSNEAHPTPFWSQNKNTVPSAPEMYVSKEKMLKGISRPSQIYIYDGVTFSGKEHVIYTNVMDAAMLFLHGASVRVTKGCWLLYQDPGYQGPCVALEEGETVLTHIEALASPAHGPTAIAIGSIRSTVKNDLPPEILLHPPAGRRGSPESFTTETSLCTPGGIQLSCLTVKSGCWLAYEGVAYSGNYAVLQAERLPTPGPNGILVTSVKSLRPLSRAGPKVRSPLDPKMIVYREPGFVGRSEELADDVATVTSTLGLQEVASMRVLGGVWVGFTREGYRGQQCLLEEGEYADCQELGLTEHALLSFQFLRGDFFEPSLSLHKAVDITGVTESIIGDLDVPDLEQVGPVGRTASICVRSGVWVAYSERFYCGHQCVLEKGTYAADLDWGDSSGPALSLRPIRMGGCSSGEPEFFLRAYSQTQYRGESREYRTEVTALPPFIPASFRVIRGSWLLFGGESHTGNQFVLGEGLYPDLISCGCDLATPVRSLRPIPYSFSDPSISLFSLEFCQGLEMTVRAPVDSMDSFFAQSLIVHSGLWVAFEHAHYRGRQKLLACGDVPAWTQLSGWETLGSLRPLAQPKFYIRVRSRAQCSLLLTAEDLQDKRQPGKAFLSPASGRGEQLWAFSEGLLRCKASKTCLSVVGRKASAGTPVALWPQHGRTNQKWSLKEDGTISTQMDHTLVLDVKGGQGFDREHLIVSSFAGDRLTQQWDIEMA